MNFENLVDAGDPVELAAKYYREGADELTFLDVNASKLGRSTVIKLVRKTAQRVFIPLTVGGGVRSADDVARLLEAGADKVSVASAGIQRPELLSEISKRFGSQVLVVSLDLKRSSNAPSGFTVTSHGGSVDENLDAIDWICKVQELGAGELLVNSIDADGTKQGFDLELLHLVRKHAALPLIVSGGAGSYGDFVAAAESGADAVLAASVFHTGELSIAGVKQALSSAGSTVRAVA
jgi:imidazole glycerol-phosphate synthase subunit HisF